jgi:hypothetical protein
MDRVVNIQDDGNDDPDTKLPTLQYAGAELYDHDLLCLEPGMYANDSVIHFALR